MALGTLPAGAQTALVNHSDAWRYHKGTGATTTGWKTVAESALNTTWLSGAGGFGYADNTTETSLCGTLLPDMKGLYSTVAMRRSFQITTPPVSSGHLVLTMDWDDGFIAWLDGAFLASANSPGSPAEPAFNAVATALHESSRGDSTKQAPTRYDLGAVGARLGPGTHVLALVGLNQALGSSGDFIQVAELAVDTNLVNCVSGAIAANTTWRATNSPLRVCGDITVNSGVTLTVEPGTTVQFDAGVGLTVSSGGRLLAEGTSNAPIAFTRTAGAANWDHVTIQGAAGSPESRIAHAHFDFNAASTGTPCIEVAAGTAWLDHLTFGNTGAPYIHVDGASFIISDCIFPSATARFELVHGTGGIKAGGHGLFLRNYFGVPIGYNDVVDFTGGNRPAPIVHFIGNVLAGSQDDGLDLDGTDAWIEGNIFLHVHRNGDTPDSSAAVSGGNNSTAVSEITVIGNLFFDCDNAATAKQGNFFTFLNNTIVHSTRTGGIDGGSGVVNVRDTTPSPTLFGKGYYLEGNVVLDAEQLVRNYDAAQTTVTLIDNLLPAAWTGPGTGNVIADPKLKHVPTVAETAFTSWSQAQIMWDWFSLLPGSPALSTGPNNLDRGGVIPHGASLSGEPPGLTVSNAATLRVGINRTGFGMPITGWPEGAGYTHYRWRLDGGAWSPETPIASALALTGLGDGPHFVEVAGKMDSGVYQDDPLLGPEAGVTRSRTWTVANGPRIDSILLAGASAVQLKFLAQANTGYSIQYRDSLANGGWQTAAHLDPIPSAHSVTFTNTLPAGTASRFFRLSVP